MAKLWPGHDSGTHTHTRTELTLYAHPPFYGGGIKNGGVECRGEGEGRRKH